MDILRDCIGADGAVGRIVPGGKGGGLGVDLVGDAADVEFGLDAVGGALGGGWQVAGLRKGEEPDALGGEQGIAGEDVAGAQVGLQGAREFAV